MRYIYTEQMYTGIAKPIRIIGVPDNLRPDKWSYTLMDKTRIKAMSSWIWRRVVWQQDVEETTAAVLRAEIYFFLFLKKELIGWPEKSVNLRPDYTASRHTRDYLRVFRCTQQSVLFS